MRHRNTLLLIGSLAVASLVIVLGVIFFRMDASPTVALSPNGQWTLTSLQVNGQTHPLVQSAPITLTFDESSHTITGRSGCNSYQATYQQSHSQIRIQDFESTLVLCQNPVEEQENLYQQALSHAETLQVSAHAMTITGAGGKDTLRFSSSQP